jgi:hypothetical protein
MCLLDGCPEEGRRVREEGCMRHGRGCCGGCCLPVVVLTLLVSVACLASPLLVFVH